MTRPEFEQIVAAAPRQSLKRNYIVGTNQSVGNGATLNIDVFSPTGTISQLLFFSTVIQAAATAGTGHTVNLLYTNGLNPVVQIIFTGTTAIRFGNSVIYGINISNIPPVAQIPAEYRSIIFDATVGLRLQYVNNTGGSYTFGTTNYYELMVLEQTISN